MEVVAICLTLPTEVVAICPTLPMEVNTSEYISLILEKRLNQNVNSFMDATNGRGAKNRDCAENVA